MKPLKVVLLSGEVKSVCSVQVGMLLLVLPFREKSLHTEMCSRMLSLHCLMGKNWKHFAWLTLE